MSVLDPCMRVIIFKPTMSKNIFGKRPREVLSAELTQDNKLRIRYTDNSTPFESSSLKGDTGPQGNGIDSSNTGFDSDNKLTITFEDGTSVISDSLKGTDGADGTVGTNLNSSPINLIDSSLWDLFNGPSGGDALSWQPNSSSPESLKFDDGVWSNGDIKNSNKRPFAITKDKIISSRFSEIIFQVEDIDSDNDHRLDIRFHKEHDFDAWIWPTHTSQESLEDYEQYGVTITKNSPTNAYFKIIPPATFPGNYSSNNTTHTNFSSNANWPKYNVSGTSSGPTHRRIVILHLSLIHI